MHTPNIEAVRLTRVLARSQSHRMTDMKLPSPHFPGLNMQFSEHLPLKPHVVFPSAG